MAKKVPKKVEQDFPNTFFIIITSVSVLIGIFLGIWIEKSTDQVKKVNVTDLYYENAHYIIIEGKDGGVTTVNYTLDSAKQELTAPHFQIIPDDINKH